jgi:Beta-propeller repeat
LATDYPVTPNAFQMTKSGSYDVFLTRLSATGNALLYSTYIGGNGFDNARGLAVNDAGHAWVAGQTQSNDFPVRNAIQPTHAPDGGRNDAFIVRMDTNQPGLAALVFGTYYGGNAEDGGVGTSVTCGLAIDPLGNVLVAGSTSSTDLRTVNAFQPSLGGGIDGFALKLDPAGNLIYATYIGGSADDLAFTAALDGAGHGYVAGTTASSTTFPLKNPVQGTFGGGSGDMFLLKLDVNGQLLFSTYLGGHGSEFPGRVSVDPAGNVFLTGNTASADFTQVASVQGTYGGGATDAFVMQINPAGSHIALSTFLGGTGSDDIGWGAVPDSSGNVTVALKSDSPNLPVVAPLQSTNHGGADVYVARLTLPGGLVASDLPISRAIVTGGTATVFATMINTGPDLARGCSITPVSLLPITSLYQTTNPATNQLTGNPNVPVDIPPGGFQTFLIAITSTSAFAATDIPFSYGCANRPSATVISGVNTLVMASSDTQTADVVALGATPSKDGIINIPGPTGTGIFGVATSNVGATGDITVSADTGGASLPVNLFLCQTNPATGDCLQPLATSVTVTVAAGATPTFALFAQGTGNVPFNPGANRAFMRFKQGLLSVGATSAALRTQ